MNCPKCSAALIPDAKFCGACGTQMSAPPAAQQPQPQQQWSQPQHPQQPQQSRSQQPAPAGGGINIDSDARGEGRGYSWEILHQPAFALAIVRLGAEQSILAGGGGRGSMCAASVH